MAERREVKNLSAVEEAELSQALLYRLGAKLLKNRILITSIATLMTAFMAYQAAGMKMSTSFGDLLPYRHPFVQVHHDSGHGKARHEASHAGPDSSDPRAAFSRRGASPWQPRTRRR